MTIDLKLSPEAEARLRAQVAAAGQDVQTFVLEAVTDKLAEAEVQPEPSCLADVEWKKKLKEAIALHPVVAHFVDDSRESNYEGRGE